MNWDELHIIQFEEVNKFKEQRAKDFETLERNPAATDRDFAAFHGQSKYLREQLYKKHVAEAEKFLDQQQYRARQLAYLKTMARDYPENEYWSEAAERMETKQKQEELKQAIDRKRSNSSDRDR